MSKKISPKKLNERWYRFLRRSCKIFCKIFFRTYIYGQENIPDDGAFVLVSNHQSVLDPMLCVIFMKKPVYFLARHTLFDNRLSSWLFSSINAIPINRGEGETNLSAIRTAISRLKQGKIICIFPEATRTVDGKIAPFKPGFCLLCRLAKIPVVPLMIDGAFECWPKNKKMFFPGQITIYCGKALAYDRINNMKDNNLAKLLTDQLRQTQNDYRIKHGKKPYAYG